MNRLERYRAGEHIGVWHELILAGDVLSPQEYQEAIIISTELMQRFSTNLSTIIANLNQIGYRFGYDRVPDAPKSIRPSVHAPPPADIQDILARYTNDIHALPLSVSSLYQNIGAFNLIGRFPDDIFIDYSIDAEKFRILHQNQVDEIKSLHGDMPLPTYFNESGQIALLDPLQIFPFAIQFDLHKDWIEEYFGMDETDEEFMPYHFPLSWDSDLKIGASGLDFYQIELGNPIDGQVLFEPHQLYLIDYLRLCIRWGGFPGFELLENPPTELVRKITSGIIDF